MNSVLNKMLKISEVENQTLYISREILLIGSIAVVLETHLI